MSQNKQNHDLSAPKTTISIESYLKSYKMEDNSTFELILDFSDLLRECEGSSNTDYASGEVDCFPEKYFPDKVDTRDNLSDFKAKYGNNPVVSAALKVIHNIREHKYSPFYIYGDSAAAAEHLLLALLNEIKDCLPDYSVCYIDSESLVGKINNCYRKEISIPDPQESLVDVLQKYDIILFNNIKFLSNDDICRKVFSEAVNRLKDQDKHLVFTAHSLPEDLDGFSAEIISFLKSAVCKKLEDLHPQEQNTNN